MRGGFNRYISTGHGKPRKGPWISEGPHSISHWRFILIFALFLGTFNSNPQSWERFQPVLRAQSVLYHLAKFLVEAMFLIHHHNSFTTYNKMKKSITSWEKFHKFNRKIVEIGKCDIPNTHIHDHSLSWLSTGTSVKSDGVKLVGL
jgi:hypothetical protein